jgi:hypothetical protein
MLAINDYLPTQNFLCVGRLMDIPLQLQTAYQELLQHHAAEPDVSIEGSIVRREKGGRGYWVARKRVGAKVTESAIGPDTEETQAVVSAVKTEQERHKAWSRAASSCVSILRAGGCLAPDMKTGQLLAAIARTGFFASGGVLGGTQAFRHYPLMLSVAPPSAAFSMTGDVDLMASSTVRLSGASASLAARIREQGIEMEPVLGMQAKEPSKWRVSGVLDLEFLSTVGRGGEGSHLHAGIGERVQALKYLEYSLKDAVEAVSLYRSGVSIRVPAPERYALHKMLVAQLRSGSFREKRRKDLDQAAWLLEVLVEHRAYDLWQAWADLRARGVKWRTLIDASLKERLDLQEYIGRIEEEFGSADA